MIPVIFLATLFAIILSVPELRDAEPVARHRREGAPEKDLSRRKDRQLMGIR